MKRAAIVGLEIALIVTLYFVYTASDAPAVNESHYLTKAKHYWNPAWCHRDLFLQSADAHLSFYWTVGWTTKFLSLRSAAWVARIAAWLFLAITWWRLSNLMVARTGFALLTAAISLVCWDIADAAGEWVVGGVEGKVFAYGFVWLGMAAMIRGQWSRVWIFFGVASAFHALVGGWSVIAAVFVWSTERRDVRPSLARMFPALAAGGAIALFGVLPSLSLERGLDAEVARRSHHVYVFFRLAHHLVFHRMRWWRIAAHLLLISVWVTLWQRHASEQTKELARASEDVEGSDSSHGLDRSRLHRFAVGAVLIAICGIGLDVYSIVDAKRAASWLRFYWFRLSDVMVGVAATFAAVHAWSAMQEVSQADRKRSDRAAVAVLLLIACLFTARFTIRHRDRRPIADSRSVVLRTASVERAHAEYADWRALCNWARNETSTDSLWLTPTRRQTFKWYAHRAELVTRKDIPQDAASVGEWRGRMGIVGSLGIYREDRMPDQKRLVEVTDHYNIDYVVVERRFGQATWTFPKIYENEHFVVYRISQSDSLANRCRMERARPTLREFTSLEPLPTNTCRMR